MPNETVVTLQPVERGTLNAALIKEKGLSDEAVEKIIQVHGLMDGVIENPTDYDDPVRLIELYELWLQTIWGFPQDKTFHIHWVRIDGCTCPKLDNRLLAGVEMRLISKCCPWHYKGESK